MKMVDRDTQEEIVVGTPWQYLAAGCLLLLMGISGLIVLTVIAFPIKYTLVLFLLIPSIFPVGWLLLGIYYLGWRTKVTFNQPPGYITVTRGHIPIFLPQLRRRCISREEAKSVYLRSVGRNLGGGGWRTAHEVRIITEAGKELTLCDCWKRDKVEYLVQRFFAIGSGQEAS
jgi:hypothetical protein